jgi:broad specificity phosphatase PhoE
VSLLILVKHSQPEIVTNVPAREWGLSDIGRQRCATLAEQLRIYTPEVMVASKEPKAAETGQITAKILDVPFEIRDNLHEHERHNEQYSGVATFHTNIRGFFMQPNRLVYGIETADDAHDRFSAAVEDVLKEFTGKNIAIVAHGTVITLFISRRTGLEPFALWNSLGLPSFIVYDTNAATVVGSVHDIP